MNMDLQLKMYALHHKTRWSCTVIVLESRHRLMSAGQKFQFFVSPKILKQDETRVHPFSPSVM